MRAKGALVALLALTSACRRPAAPAGPLALAVPCDAAPEAVYQARAAGPSVAPEALGDVLACARDTRVDGVRLAARRAAAGLPAAGAGEVQTFRVAYATTRGDGDAGVSTARVYLPASMAPGPRPLVVAAHGTAGLADACAPSRWETADDALVLPWVARGWPVIAPDYAGLGNSAASASRGRRVQGYGDSRDTGRSTLDAARALRKLLPAGAAGPATLVVGHSQGGGSALAAQALSRSYGAGIDLAGVVAFAPGWATTVDLAVFRHEHVPTVFGRGVPAAVSALHAYAWAFNRLGAEHAGDLFAPASRAPLVGLIESQCVYQLAGSLPHAAATFGSLFDPTFREGALACLDRGACAGPSGAYVQDLRDSVLAADRDGARALLVEGLRDDVVPPSHVACVRDKLAREGASALACTEASADHISVVPHASGLAIAWAESLLSRSPPPACSSALPACER